MGASGEAIEIAVIRNGYWWRMEGESKWNWMHTPIKANRMGPPIGSGYTDTLYSSGSGGLMSPAEEASIILALNKGDRATLKNSNRRFEVIDERKDEKGAFEELCKFEDDTRHPVWISHSELVSEIKDINSADSEVPQGVLW